MNTEINSTSKNISAIAQARKDMNNTIIIKTTQELIKASRVKASWSFLR